MAQFSELLVELRQDKKMTQEDLAKVLFVTTLRSWLVWRTSLG